MDARKLLLGLLAVLLLISGCLAVVRSNQDDPAQVAAYLEAVNHLDRYIETINPSHSHFIGARPRRWDAEHIMFGSVTVVATDEFYYSLRLSRLRNAENLFDYWCAGHSTTFFRSIRFVDRSGNVLAEIDADGLHDASP